MKKIISYRIIRALFISLLSAVILIAATGLSYSVHYCHGSQTEIQLFPELIYSQPTCGCDVNMTGFSMSAEESKTDVLSKTKCCKNLHYFQKIQLLSFELQKKELNVHQALLLSPLKSEYLAFQKFAKIEEPLQISQQEHVLPSGKSWILIHHQIRIPSPSSDC